MKLKITLGIAVLFSTILLVGCDSQKSAPANGAALLMFMEYENNVAPYQTRLIVTQEYMRFDDGEGSVDFVLFDRKKEIIYSVNSLDRTVMAVERQHTELEPPFKLKLTEQNLGVMKESPSIEDKQPLHYVFSANDEVCYEVVVVPGLMPNVVNAMKAFDEILASDSKVTFHLIPADLHNACDMAMSTFAPGRHYAYGFPIQEWTKSGDGRTLVDYQLDYKPKTDLFVLPSDYKHFTVQDFREGKVEREE